MALGHLVVGILHHGGTVHIGGHFPAKGLIEQIILGSRGQILAAPDHMGDAHQVVVDDIGEVIGGQAVPLDEHLVVQVSFSTVMSPKMASWKVVVPPLGIFWRMTYGSPASTRA